MPALSNRLMLAVGLAAVVGIGIILVAQTTAQKGNPLAVLGATKTVFLHEKPETSVMWNDTGHSYFNMQGNVFQCDSTFDGSIYYQKNETNYFKCIDDGSTRGENVTYQIVP
jgi:hypothetical protein